MQVRANKELWIEFKDIKVETHEDSFTIPKISTSSDYLHIDLDRLCEDTLQKLLSKKSSYVYFNTEAHHSVWQKNLVFRKEVFSQVFISWVLKNIW